MVKLQPAQSYLIIKLKYILSNHSSIRLPLRLQLFINLLIQRKQLILQFLLFFLVRILVLLIVFLIQNRGFVGLKSVLLPYSNHLRNQVNLLRNLLLPQGFHSFFPRVCAPFSHVDLVDYVAGESDEEEAWELQVGVLFEDLRTPD